jgi:hypothetical protein
LLINVDFEYECIFWSASIDASNMKLM